GDSNILFAGSGDDEIDLAFGGSNNRINAGSGDDVIYVNSKSKSKRLQCFFVLFPNKPMPINLFDANFYRSANSDLNGLSDKQAWSHFKSYGLDNGLEFSSLVDLDFYRASNSDLADLNNRELLEHLVNYGVSEGRKFSSLVDLDFYRKTNSDKASLNYEELLDDLQNKGISEGDSFSPFFNINYYLADNPDIAQTFGNSYKEAFENFVIEGLNSGDSFSASFDAQFYKNAHNDLTASSLNNEKLLEHFAIKGLSEGRASAPGFDVKYYLNNNPELKDAGFSYSDAYEHFVSVGLHDGLRASEFIEKDRAGNDLNNARTIALDSGEIIFRDSIGNSDADDFYNLNLNNPNSNLEITINGSSANVDLELLDSSGEIIARAANSDNNSEFLGINNLENGTYYIRVFEGVEADDTNYNLSLSITPIDTESETIVLDKSSPVPSTATSSVSNSPQSSQTIDPLVAEVVALTNSYRAQHGLQPLTLNTSLSTSAQTHSQDMALADFFSHTGSNGSRVSERTKSAGYESSYVGQNIAAGQITAEEVVRGWMNSPGHRENILNPNYKEIGIGYYYLANDTGEVNYNRYWTQDFGAVIST
ncbi:MAG: CAP domain-containing protein, partial [Cyanobacteriota bacterium]|nr:CAP domain-containing protein [Cyanobacteriota bacterium]